MGLFGLKNWILGEPREGSLFVQGDFVLGEYLFLGGVHSSGSGSKEKVSDRAFTWLALSTIKDPLDSPPPNAKFQRFQRFERKI